MEQIFNCANSAPSPNQLRITLTITEPGTLHFKVSVPKLHDVHLVLGRFQGPYFIWKIRGIAHRADAHGSHQQNDNGSQ